MYEYACMYVACVDFELGLIFYGCEMEGGGSFGSESWFKPTHLTTQNAPSIGKLNNVFVEYIEGVCRIDTIIGLCGWHEASWRWQLFDPSASSSTRSGFCIYRRFQFEISYYKISHYFYRQNKLVQLWNLSTRAPTFQLEYQEVATFLCLSILETWQGGQYIT